MKKKIFFTLALLLSSFLISTKIHAKEYTHFNIVFEEKEGEAVSETELKIYASVDEGALVDRTAEFTTEDVKWYRYLPKPENGKTADDYDYVDEELEIYGMLVSANEVFELNKYSYFLVISRLYAQEEDTFHRNVKINGVDVEEMQGICYNTGNEFFIKTITHGSVGSSGEEAATSFEVPPHAAAGNKVDERETGKNKCKICGICPLQPLGICLFIWLAVALLAAIGIVKAKRK